MGRLLVVILVGAVCWFIYANWGEWTQKPTKDNYVGKEYKQSLDKAREVEGMLQQHRQAMDEQQP